MHKSKIVIDEHPVRVREYQTFLETLSPEEREAHTPPDWEIQRLRPNWPVRIEKRALAERYCVWSGGRLPTKKELLEAHDAGLCYLGPVLNEWWANTDL